jgi:phage tail tape-measure protein
LYFYFIAEYRVCGKQFVPRQALGVPHPLDAGNARRGDHYGFDVEREVIDSEGLARSIGRVAKSFRLLAPAVHREGATVLTASERLQKRLYTPLSTTLATQ